MKENIKPNSFAKKVRDNQQVIMYELLPPPSHLSEVDLDTSISLFAQRLKNYPIDGVNIPEVREEVRSGARSGTTVVKLEPREVCRYLQKYGIKNLIINRPVVYLPWEQQQQWLNETFTKYGITANGIRSMDRMPAMFMKRLTWFRTATLLKRENALRESIL